MTGGMIKETLLESEMEIDAAASSDIKSKHVLVFQTQMTGPLWGIQYLAKRYYYSATDWSNPFQIDSKVL